MPQKKNDLVPVTEFITASESNLKIAAAVYQNYTEARDLILRQFFERLGERLVCQREEWCWAYAPPFFVERFAAFTIAKISWQGKYEIRIEACNWGERMIGGVWRDDRLLGHTNYIPGLPEAFAAVSQHPKRRSWYEAEFDIHSPASDWREPATLWRIHTDPRFLSEVEALLQNWIEISVPFLDEASRQEK